MSVKLNLLAPSTGASNQGVDYSVVTNTSSNDTLANDKKATYVPDTLAGELHRIKAYIAEIGREAALLALKASGAKVDEKSNLDKIAEAMLSIVKNSAADASNASTYQKNPDKEELVLDAGTETVLPAGYYVDAVTVKATSLRDQSQATATAKDILDGATAWVNGVKITGTSTTNLSDKSAGNAAYTEVNDKLVINLKGNDAAAEDKFVNTGIKFVTQNEVPNKVVITKVTTPDAEETAAAEAIEIPAGYYPTAVSIPVHIEDAAGNEEKVLNVTKLNVTGDVAFGNAENYKFDPSTSEGAGRSFDYYTEVVVDKAALVKNNTTGGYTVGKAGWVNSNDAFAGLSEGSYKADAADVVVTPKVDGATVTIAKAVHGYTPDKVVVNIAAVANPEDQEAVELVADKDAGKVSFDTTVNITAGYHNAKGVVVKGEVDLNTIAGSHEFAEATPSAAEKPQYDNVVASQFFTDKVQHGYIKNDVDKKYKVRDAEITEVPTSSRVEGKAAITVRPSTTGWFEGATILMSQAHVKNLVNNLTTVETVSYTSTNTAESSAIANTKGAIVTAKEGSFYDSVNMSSLLTELKGI